jgi:hypothetical protein
MPRAFDIGLVRTYVDPYLSRTITKKSYDLSTGRMVDVPRNVIVDDGVLPGNDAMMTGSQIATAQLLRGIPEADSTEGYWLEYGRRTYQRFLEDGPFGLRCDTCTALAFYVLRHHGFTGAISVIEQAIGKANGHWFLLAGCPPDETIAYKSNFPRGSFVIDLWGVGVMRQRGESTSDTSVIEPSSCVYSCGDNRLQRKVHVNGQTTAPSAAKFISATTVPGCFGNKSRSTALKALDSRLGQYHSGKATLDQLGLAFTAWINKKAQRKSEDIVSIRNADGAMRKLREQMIWLGKVV